MRKVIPLTPSDAARAKLLALSERVGDCWEWQAAVDLNGYGRMYIDSTTVKPHRMSYVVFVGPIPDGLVIDHLCRNRRCINPDHLEPVTDRENLMRGEGVMARVARTGYCKRGHRRTPEMVTVNGCRICVRARHRARYAASTAEERARHNEQRRLRRLRAKALVRQ